MHRLLKPADYVRMPWKNGGGQTTEIAVYPSGSTQADFDWRVSIADVAADAPFSAFAGVDRTLALLSGAGMRLTGATHATELRAPYEPYRFSGDDETTCTLVDGPVRDFNLMVRRARARGELVVVRAEAARIAPARWRICHTAAGAVECLVPGHPPLTVAQDNTVVFDDGAGSTAAISVNPVSPDAVALVAVIEPAA
jgi:hypothetical protein